MLRPYFHSSLRARPGMNYGFDVLEWWGVAGWVHLAPRLPAHTPLASLTAPFVPRKGLMYSVTGDFVAFVDEGLVGDEAAEVFFEDFAAAEVHVGGECGCVGREDDVWGVPE